MIADPPDLERGDSRAFGEPATTHAQRMAEIPLTTAAIGFTTIVQLSAKVPESMHEEYVGSREHLLHTALKYARDCGELNAGERAELVALRKFRDGIVALRSELARWSGEHGEEAAETIDALLTLLEVKPT